MATIAAQVEVQMGHGWPPIVKAMEYVLEESAPTSVPTRAITNENSPTWNSPKPTASGTIFP